MSTNLFAQNKISKLDISDMETSILFTAFPIININDYQSNINSKYSFYQAYKAIAENDIKKRLPNLNNLIDNTKKDFSNNTVSLGILNTSFEIIKPETYENGNLIIDSEGDLIKTTNDYIYNKHELAIVAPLQVKHKGLKVNFNLFEKNIFNTTQKTITNIKIDFGNEEGFKTISKNSNITINYIVDGSKTLTSELTFSDGTSTISKSTIDIKYSNTDLNTLFNRVVNTFDSSNTPAPNLTPYGEFNNIGTGEYEIFLSPDNILDKPIFLIDGFDPGDSRDITGLYSLLDYDNDGTNSNLADVVRAEGYDIIILNFPVYTRVSDSVIVDGGADFIERNAMLLVELLNIINSSKITGADENVIIGPSMGGVISRYALNFMENQNLDHDTRLWLSFDAPHHGANVPIGFQHLFNYMAYGLDLGGLGGDQSIVALRPIVDGMLKSPAARQMLIDHFEPHLANGSTVDFDPNLKLPIKHPWNTIFYTELNNLTTSGYPENTRNISIINGSGIGAPYLDKTGNDILPNREILNTTIEDVSFQTDATFKVKYTPYSGQQNQASYLFIDSFFLCFCDLTASATVESESFSNGIDAASGGLFNIGAIAGSLGTDPLINSFFNALQTDYFNFIPTVSSLALENDGNINWFHVPNNLTTASLTVNNTTPFDAWHIPDDNEEHVTLTNSNVNFALDEIIVRSSLAAKVYLQGPLLNSTDNMMKDDLRIAGIIPTTSPYNNDITIAPSILNTTGPDAIVDWVFVELRDSSNNTNIIASQSALIQRDGDIVNIDGSSNLHFNNTPSNNYFVAIKHQNHLDIMSNTAVPLSRIATSLDFTNANNQITFGTDAQTSFGVPENTVAMWAGDSNNDGRLNYLGALSDVPNIRSQVFNDPNNSIFGGPPVATYGSLGYYTSDINMDGMSFYAGGTSDVLTIRNNIFNNPSNSVFGGPPVATFTFTQQLPEGASN